MRVFVDRVEGEKAVLLTQDGQKLIVPLRLAEDAREGRVYKLILQPVGTTASENGFGKIEPAG